MILSGVKNNNTGPRNEGSGDRSLSKNPGFFDSNKAPGFPGALCCSAGD